MKKQQITLQNIETALYGPDGFSNQIKSEITKLTVREIADRTGKSPQAINIFRHYKRPKIETLIQFGKAVGII